MKKVKVYTVTLNRPCDVNIKKALQSAGVNFKFSTELNPHLIFVEAKDIKQLTDLEFVSEAKKSGIAKLY